MSVPKNPLFFFVVCIFLFFLRVVGVPFLSQVRRRRPPAGREALGITGLSPPYYGQGNKASWKSRKVKGFWGGGSRGRCVRGCPGTGGGAGRGGGGPADPRAGGGEAGARRQRLAGPMGGRGRAVPGRGRAGGAGPAPAPAAGGGPRFKVRTFCGRRRAAQPRHRHPAAAVRRRRCFLPLSPPPPSPGRAVQSSAVS